MVAHLESLFPGLRGSSYKVTSPPDDIYNCVAWAAYDQLRWWWPNEKRYWPQSVQQEETLAAFKEVFASLGNRECAGQELEPGFEKVALFADPEGFPTHATRQLESGRWTSKLGELEDIEHGLLDLEGLEYGTVVLVMKRPLAGSETKGEKG